MQKCSQVPDLSQCFQAISASWKSADWVMVVKICVLEGSLPSPGAISPMQPTRPFGRVFSSPSQLHSTHAIWDVSGFCPPPQKPPWGPAPQGRSPAAGPPQSPWSCASWPERWGPALGAPMAGCQNSPFKAPFLLLLLLLPRRSIGC